jgi:2,3-bisphosphoglycerate-independent phosphoglycerate mutase
MSPSEYAFRCNVVTLTDEDDYFERTMLDHSAGEITTSEADELVKALEEKLGSDVRRLYTGVSYRHCLIWDNPPGWDKNERIYDFSRPHDIIGRKIRDYLPKGEIGDEYCKLFVESAKILKDHPVNVARRRAGKNVANSIWLWSPGKKPQLSLFKDRYGINGAVISAVDLIKGIGICAGMRSIDVEGATGNYKTNYKGKADAAISAFREGADFVYVHVEGPDECGHTADALNKVRSIEDIDSKILAPVMEYLDSTGEHYRVLLMPDHPTPCEIRTHSHENVPFAIYDSREPLQQGVLSYNEFDAEKTGFYIDKGHELLEKLFIK